MRASRKKLSKVTPMSKALLPREELAKLRVRAGLSLEAVAKSLSYKSASGYNRYELDRTQGSRKIPYDVIKRLIPLFRGAGNPPITLEEMLAISDVGEGVQLPKVQAFAMASVVDAGGKGLLVVRFKINEGTFIALEARGRSFGSSRIGVSASYPEDCQFVIAVETATPRWPVGTQLHCVEPSCFEGLPPSGFPVVVACPYKGSELVELKTGTLGQSAATNGTVFGDDKYPLEGKVVAYIVGSYQPTSG